MDLTGAFEGGSNEVIDGATKQSVNQSITENRD